MVQLPINFSWTVPGSEQRVPVPCAFKIVSATCQPWSLANNLYGQTTCLECWYIATTVLIGLWTSSCTHFYQLNILLAMWQRMIPNKYQQHALSWRSSSSRSQNYSLMFWCIVVTPTHFTQWPDLGMALSSLPLTVFLMSSNYCKGKYLSQCDISYAPFCLKSESTCPPMSATSPKSLPWASVFITGFPISKFAPRGVQQLKAAVNRCVHSQTSRVRVAPPHR